MAIDQKNAEPVVFAILAMVNSDLHVASLRQASPK
jgi:hypothetical protein